MGYTLSNTKAKNLDEEQAGMLIGIIMSEQKGDELSVLADDEFIEELREEAPAAFIVATRATKMAEGKMTRGAALLGAVYARRPGFAVLFAIDCLEAFGTEEVITANRICQQLYPYGFYTDEEAEKRCDQFKNREGVSKYENLY